ncbi:MAG: GIY-YIG nuclease family protein [Bacteroidales bacterium]|nr:GIY-YIG nuclease family protein [Bacteroidales bacterium]
MKKGGYIYIMTNNYRTTFYVGVTSDLERRVQEHRTHFYKHSFTAKYNLEKCIYYEYFLDIEQAIEREKQLKKWSRSKKEILINRLNPEWNNLV